LRSAFCERIAMHPETDLSRVIAAAGAAHAQEKIRVGRIGPFSGPFASVGVMFKQGIETYLAANGTKVGGRDVELLYRDTAGTNPAGGEAARRRADRPRQGADPHRALPIAGSTKRPYCSSRAARGSPSFPGTSSVRAAPTPRMRP
jgi:hypothetical protein